MVTKYLCMVAGCDFVSEKSQEATNHLTEHSDDENAAIAEVGYAPAAGTTCSTFIHQAAEA